ncbi:porin [uncultured Oxalicibacterium sp.]|uniref:porin n=1 Tax=uncultured Oxalicibacterium sp. TaxID=1168540 RepID=UPI0025DDE07A|nr:porin [uncultured Oxalicibacterium sp.]
MKKSLLALAVLGAFAGAASAQSSVTVYGIVDLGFTSIDNGNAAGRVNGISSGGQSASRIGFKGTEDLGGGLAANFQLEGTIAADTGAAFQTSATGGSNGGFNRIATVGLSGAFGKVDLGRQTSAIKDAYDQIDPFGDGGVIAPISAVFFNGALSSDNGRINNAVKYSTPSFGGFKATAAYGFGETAGDTGANSNYGIGLGYANGPLNVQFAYHNQDVSTYANPSAQTGENKLAFIGATYNFGAFKLHGAYADTKFETGLNATAAQTKYRNGMVGVSLPLGPGSLFVNYAINDNRTTNNADSKKAAVMYSYDLSKRTNLYVGYSRTSNDQLATVGTGSITSVGGAGATSTAITGVAGENTSAFAVGIRHKF